MQSGQIQAIRLITGCTNLELKLEKLSHVVPNVRNEVRKVIARLLSEHAELTDMSSQPIDSMNNYLKLLPMFRVILRDVGSSMEDLRKKVEMPGAFLVNRAVPVVVITEWARPAALGAFSMESGKAMVTLYSVGKDARRRRSYCNGANARVVLIVRRIVVFRTGGLEHVSDELVRLGLFVLGAVPRQRFKPLVMDDKLLVQPLKHRQRKHCKVIRSIDLPLPHHVEQITILAVLVSVLNHVFAAIFEVNCDLGRSLQI